MEKIKVDECHTENTWRCPEEGCMKNLSRKQTLIEHVQSFHPTIKLDAGRKRGQYKKYDADPEAKVPRSTIYEAKAREIEDTSSASIPDVSQPTILLDHQFDDAINFEYNESDMSLDSDDCDSNQNIEEINLDGDVSESKQDTIENAKANVIDPNISSDPPLYVTAPHDDVLNSDITKSEHEISIATLATRHNLSNAAVSDILKVIQLHIPNSNLVVDSAKSLKESCGFDKSYLKYNVYCGICQKDSPNCEEQCQTPDCPGSITDDKRYFVTTDIELQLRELLTRPGVWEHIVESTNVETSTLSDIRSGTEYKKLQEPGGFLDGTNNLTLSMFTDGVALFSSSKVNIWPVYFVINELPPSQRFQKKNMILWGVWQGKGKPNMISYLKPMVKDLDRLFKSGFQFEFKGETITSHVMMLVATMDLQARAYLLHMTHHNGEYACLYCTVQGETVKTGNGHCKSFPYSESQTLRSDESIRADARHARQTKKRTNGFYGESILLYLSYFSLLNNVVLDYMHGALLGVTKRLLDLWFDSKYASKPWYIGRHIKTVDKIMKEIKTPYFIHRKPRALSNTYNHWKASELRNWLLFYSLPSLHTFLPNVYLVHFSCFVEGIYTLLGEGITPIQLARAHQLLCVFVKNISELYGPQYMSLNVHNLLHLKMIVEKWGPLWCWSCFSFESLNGDIISSVHGTGNVCRDIFWHVQAKKRVERKLVSLDQNSHVKQTLETILHGNLNELKKKENAKQCHFIKPEPVKSFSTEEADFLREKLGTDDPQMFQSSSKIVHNGFILYSSTTKKVKKQNSYTLMRNDGAAVQVKRYLLHCETKQVFVSGQIIHLVGPFLENRVPHIQKTKVGDGTVMQLGCIQEPLVAIEVDGSLFVALVPNHHESD